jgi:hypothetical protein
MKGSALMQSGSSVMDSMSMSMGSRPGTTTSEGGSSFGTHTGGGESGNQSPGAQKVPSNRDKHNKKINELKSIIEPLAVDHKTKHEVRDEFRQLFA